MAERDYRPDGEQFTERSASDQAFAVGSSVDLVGNIQSLRRPGTEQNKVNILMLHGFYEGNLQSLFHAAADTEQEKGLFFDDLHIAWGLVARRDALSGAARHRV